jgi:hypothetical protein
MNKVVFPANKVQALQAGIHRIYSADYLCAVFIKGIGRKFVGVAFVQYIIVTGQGKCKHSNGHQY